MAGKQSCAIFLCLLGLAGFVTARADVVVIVHPDNPVQTLTPRQVSDLYLGRTRSIGAGEQKIAVSIYEHPIDSHLRKSFFRCLNGMDIKQLNAYWARLRFSGEILPPISLPDNHSVLDIVSHNRNAIGYVDADATSNAVKVVLRLKE